MPICVREVCASFAIEIEPTFIMSTVSDSSTNDDADDDDGGSFTFSFWKCCVQISTNQQREIESKYFV